MIRFVVLGRKKSALILTQACGFGGAAVFLMQDAEHPVTDYVTQVTGMANLDTFAAYVATLLATDRLCSFAYRCSHLDAAENQRPAETGIALAAMLGFFACSYGALPVTNLAFSDSFGLRLCVAVFVMFQLVRCAHIIVIADRLRRHTESTRRLKFAMISLVACMGFAIIFLLMVFSMPDLDGDLDAVVAGVDIATLLPALASITGCALAVAGLAGPASRLIRASERA